MENLDDLITEGLDKAKLNSGDEALRQKFLNLAFKDLFKILMPATQTRHTCILGAGVIIGGNYDNAYEIAPKQPEHGERENLAKIVQRMHGFMLDSFTKLEFTTTFTDPTPSNTKKVIYFHEFDNRSVNVRKLWKSRLDKIGVAVAGATAGALSLNEFVASEPLIDIGQQSIAWAYVPALVAAIPSFVLRLSGTTQKIWKRKRKYLGNEKIVEGETSLDKKYAFISGHEKMESGVYTGQFDRYTVYNRGKVLRLKEWHEANPNRPIFQIKVTDNSLPYSIIWTVSFNGEIGQRSVHQEEYRAFYRHDRSPAQGTDKIDERYVIELKPSDLRNS